MLAMLDGGCASHPPLECLFTIDEERGLTGASHLDPGWLEARRMINLDSEEEGHFCIGCAGGVDVGIEGRFTPVPAPQGLTPFSVRVEGLKGGHSGMEIHRGRANSIRILGRVLRTLVDGHGCSVAAMAGGSKRNAIPRTASALVLAPPGGLEGMRQAVAAIQARQREEFSPEDGGLTITITEDDALPESVMPSDFASRAVDLLLSLHHGVERMSCISPGLVETSCNLAILESGAESVSLVLTARSLVETAKHALVDRLDASARLAGFSHARGNGYPGWKPDTSSELLSSATAYYRELTGTEPLVEAVHAGLECGIIGDRVGGMDMISTGPDIRGVHAPGERVCISSTGRFWEFLCGLLARL
jgi:dipeptidase D